MVHSKTRDSCRELFKTLEVLPFFPQNIFSLLIFVVKNKHLFTKNLEVHNKDVRSANIFLLPFTNLTKCQKGAHCVGIKMLNHFPARLICSANEIPILKLVLKLFLLSNSFCSLEKYFNCNK